MHYINSFLDRHTMYQVVIGVLGVWVVSAVLLSLGTLVPYDAVEMTALLTVLLAASLGTHFLCAYLFKAPANLDSSIITALILFFLFSPTLVMGELGAAALAAALAIASKYVLAYRKLHILNPVAFGVVAVSLLEIGFATWWVATPWLLPFVAGGGFLIARKINRLLMVSVGIIVAFVLYLVFALQSAVPFTADTLTWFFIASPVVFFFTVMVTEPLSTPGRSAEQLAYAAFIGVMMSIPFSIGSVYNTPELTLVLANILFYPLSLRERLTLPLKEMKTIAHNTIELCFEVPRRLRFTSGQYLEWTLPHKDRDARGIRRYFTIASAPEETELKIGVRVAEEGSSFKRTLQNLKTGDHIYATARAGDFVLSEKTDTKYLFIAGGIGITPFVSHVRHTLATDAQFDAVLLYCNKTEQDIAYHELFTAAASSGLVTHHILSEPTEAWSGLRGFITEALLKEQVPDYKERVCYISGPPAMVGAYTTLLRKLGVPAKSIKVDYFPGLA